MPSTTDEQKQTTESIAFKAGRKAREHGIALKDSALRHLHPESRQYAEFIDGYLGAKRNSTGDAPCQTQPH